MRWTVHLAGLVERRGEHRVLGRKHEGKRQLGRSGRRWKTNVKFDLQDMGRKSWDWICLARNM